jgi:DNA invertase Pin-like site-specific DNA recombinase
MSQHVISAYIRTSTTDQTVEQQMAAVEGSYPEGTMIHWYMEQTSGWQGNRGEWEALKVGVMKGRVKEVCAVNVARLGRNQREIVMMLDLCNSHGVKVKILDSPIDFSTPFGIALFSLFGAFAQVESDIKSANIKRKFELKKKQDPTWKMHGNIEGTVYKKVKEKSVEVYRMLDEGKSQKYIARLLELSEQSVSKLVRLRGKMLLTKADYAKMFPGWHLLPVDQRPPIPDITQGDDKNNA